MLESILHGAGLKLYINGVVIGYATGINFTRSQGVKPIYELDSPFVAELMPTTYSISGSLSGIRIREVAGLDTNGIMDLNTVQAFFLQQYVDIELVDRRSGKVVWTIQRCIFSQDSWSVSARSISTFSANFMGTFIETNTAV